MKNFILITAILLFSTSCVKKKTTMNEALLGLDYFPTEQGKFVIYNVDSTYYNEHSKKSITHKYQIKEKIADRFIDNEGKDAIRMERSIKMFNPNKPYDSIPWGVKEVWMINADKKSVQISERDIRYSKLIFPIQEKANWNGNAYNTLDEWTYSYEYIDKAEKFNGKTFENVLKVKQFDFKTIISNQVYFEKYAKGVGLVYREIIDVKSKNTANNVDIMDKIEVGLVYKQSFVSSGIE